jgi:hypothetical protein
MVLRFMCVTKDQALKASFRGDVRERPRQCATQPRDETLAAAFAIFQAL